MGSTELISNLRAMGDHLKHLESLILSTVFFRSCEAVRVALMAFTQLQDLEIEITYVHGYPETGVWDSLEHEFSELRRFCIRRRTVSRFCAFKGYED
ncbi:hypothetical protein FRB94_009849 [Tulasnella sp. JGI-2019a]|nr:hypothetical protein FRB93_013765 [Tulasnella sp. JGI-2019a]KAG9010768.1 hypothetical protein FRB94_009849 [Tulasnella sp. JGI-2019a]KAG9023258.1 hypothetical protein FRB95_013342 [Tulasnella sp. JGI-2019a]